MSGKLAFEHLEKLYESIALVIDEVGEGQEALFLSKLCLTLAHNIEDFAIIEQAIAIASQDLRPEMRG